MSLLSRLFPRRTPPRTKTVPVRDGAVQAALDTVQKAQASQASESAAWTGPDPRRNLPSGARRPTS